MARALHNVGVLKRVGTSLGAVLLTACVLAGCSGDDKAPEASEPTSATGTATSTATDSPSTPAAPYLPVPDGVELTAQGSQLKVGDSATVAYEVKQGQVGVLDIKVTRMEKTSFKKSFVGWDLDEGQKHANPYFVRATVTNRGETDLGGRRTPLYIVDGENTLVESTSFASSFEACEPGTFPRKFKTGKKTKICMVYLAPRKGDLVAVSFRPTQEFAPITWTGELEKPKPPKKDKGKKGNGKHGG
jgi:hypothetical protein